MNEQILVSIIIDNYNYGHFLKEAIDSAVNQTYLNVEVIVVDDGSKDNSFQVMMDYGARIHAICKENGGQSSAFNTGFKSSSGTVIVFLDSDDTLLPNAIENIITFFNDPTVIKVHWPLLEIDQFGNVTGNVIPRHYKLAEGNFQKHLVKYGPGQISSSPYIPPTSGNAWSRKFLDQIFPMPEPEYKLGADQYLFSLAPAFGEFRALCKPQGCYRVHGGNDTQKPLEVYMDEYFARFEHCCQSVHEMLKQNHIDTDISLWPRDTWYHQLRSVMLEIAAVVPSTDSFILVDQELWGTSSTMNGCRRIPFIERNGQYWGLPENDLAAINEIERQCTLGVSFIIFAWPAFWMLDYYKGMHEHLKTNYNCSLLNERLIIFHLTEQQSYKPNAEFENKNGFKTK